MGDNTGNRMDYNTGNRMGDNTDHSMSDSSGHRMGKSTKVYDFGLDSRVRLIWIFMLSCKKSYFWRENGRGRHGGAIGSGPPFVSTFWVNRYLETCFLKFRA